MSTALMSITVGLVVLSSTDQEEGKGQAGWWGLCQLCTAQVATSHSLALLSCSIGLG